MQAGLSLCWSACVLAGHRHNVSLGCPGKPVTQRVKVTSLVIFGNSLKLETKIAEFANCVDLDEVTQNLSWLILSHLIKIYTVCSLVFGSSV